MAQGCPADLKQRLCACPKNVPQFDLAGQNFYARLIGLHDGDSLRVAFDMNGKLCQIMTRLNGIDTPEIRSKNAQEKALAVRARDYVAAWAMPDKFRVGGNYTEKELVTALWNEPVIVYLKCGPLDKYARLIAEFYKDETEHHSLNKLLRDNGFADSYEGGTKSRTWDPKTI